MITRSAIGQFPIRHRLAIAFVSIALCLGGIYAALKKWFDIPIPETESNERRSAEQLRCWTPAAERELKPRPLRSK